MDEVGFTATSAEASTRVSDALDASGSQLDVAGSLAFFAAKHGLSQAELSERPGLGPCADALQLAASAVVAYVRRGKAIEAFQLRRRLFQARVGLVQIRLELLRRRLQAAARILKLRDLRAHRLQSFAKDLRTPVFVDQVLDEFEWVHGWPVRLKSR